MTNPQLENLLRNRQLRVTSKRLEVLEQFPARGEAIAYAQIQQALQSFDRVTLYRTLHTLEEKGIIHKARVAENEIFYALCSTNCDDSEHHHEHIHFVCSNCEVVSCVPVAKPIELTLPGFVVEDVSVEARGLCQACAL